MSKHHGDEGGFAAGKRLRSQGFANGKKLKTIAVNNHFECETRLCFGRGGHVLLDGNGLLLLNLKLLNLELDGRRDAGRYRALQSAVESSSAMTQDRLPCSPHPKRARCPTLFKKQCSIDVPNKRKSNE